MPWVDLHPSREWPVEFRYVRPSKKMRRKLGRLIRSGKILKQHYQLAVPRRSTCAT